MSGDREKTDEAATGRCRGGSCRSAPARWIWVLLVLAVAGVLMAKRAEKKSGSAGTASAAAASVEATRTPAAAPDVAGPAKALPRLVDLGAGKCIPCKMMAPVLEDLKKTYAGKLDVQFLDVWENPEQAQKYGVQVIPTQIFFDAAGIERFRHVGFFAEEDIVAKWNELGVKLAAE